MHLNVLFKRNKILFDIDIKTRFIFIDHELKRVKTVMFSKMSLYFFVKCNLKICIHKTKNIRQ